MPVKRRRRRYGHNIDLAGNNKKLLEDCPEIRKIPLEKLAVEEEGEICQTLHCHMATVLGIRAGRIVKMVARQPFGGPVIIKTNGRCLALSRSLARQIMVVKSLHPESEV